MEKNNNTYQDICCIVDVKLLQELLDNNKDIDINIINDVGDTPLMNACRYNNYEIFKLLIEIDGIDINYKNNHGTTALTISCYFFQSDIIKCLLEHPDIDITNDPYEYFGRIESVDFLIDYSFQKKILDNGRDDILLALDKFELIDPKFKEDNIELFNAEKWGLII
jgi:ankyrin repeat protein